MRRSGIYLSLICILLIAAASTPRSVLAEGDPPPTPQPIQPPWITGQNTQVYLVDVVPSALMPAGIPGTVDSPELVGLSPLSAPSTASELVQLAVPQRYQDPEDPTCGAAALGMALEFLSLSEGGEAPDTNTLIKDLETNGLLYDSGTGVEELAYLARAYGSRGASSFYGWSLEGLAGELAAGRPVVVSLGLNGQNQPGHFVTLTGMASDGTWVQYNDPVQGEQTIPRGEFLTAWGFQDYSGLTVRKSALVAASDPLLPWIGLLGAVSALVVLSRNYPMGSELNRILAKVQSLLSNPQRKGLGGQLAHSPEGRVNSSSPPHPAPAGYHWEKKVSPKYGWNDHLVTKTRQVPIMIDKKFKVDTRIWYEKVARFRTVWKDKGHYAWRKVTRYRRKKYVRYYRTTYKRRTRWVRQGWRWVRKTYYQRQRTPVYGYRNVPYTKWERYWKPKMVKEEVFDGYRYIRHEDPVYETRRVPSGRYRTEYYTENMPVYEQVGTKVNWKLKKDPIPTPSPTPEDPNHTPTTPTPTPYNPTTTVTGTSTPTQQFTATSTPKPPPTGTSTPTATIDPDLQWTPGPDPVMEGIIEGGDALLDHYSVIPPLPGDPLPALDPSYSIIPPGAVTEPNALAFVKLVEGALTLLGTARDLIKRVVLPVVDYFQNAVPTHLDPNYPEPTPPYPTPTSTPLTPTPTVNYPTPTISPSPTPTPTATEDQ